MSFHYEPIMFYTNVWVPYTKEYLVGTTVVFTCCHFFNPFRSIVSHVNLDPVKPHGVDFSRVRMWALDKLGKYYRQTLIFSSVVMPEVSSILGRHCPNYCGRVRQAGNLVINGSICRVVNTSVPVVFRKFAATSLTSSADDRFQFFVKKVMPDYVSDLRCVESVSFERIFCDKSSWSVNWLFFQIPDADLRTVIF